MVSALGYDIGTIDGVFGQNTIDALNHIASTHRLFGLDFEALFPLIDRLLAEKYHADQSG